MRFDKNLYKSKKKYIKAQLLLNLFAKRSRHSQPFKSVMSFIFGQTRGRAHTGREPNWSMDNL